MGLYTPACSSNDSFACSPRRNENSAHVRNGEKTMTKSPIEMLLENHARIKGLLDRFDEAREDDARQRLIASSLAEIAIHGALRQELVIPAMHEALEDSSVADWAARDYEEQTHTMSEISATHSPSTRITKFQGFVETVKRQLEEEEQRLVPKLKGMELQELGERMAKRREELERVRLFL